MINTSTFNIEHEEVSLMPAKKRKVATKKKTVKKAVKKTVKKTVKRKPAAKKKKR